MAPPPGFRGRAGAIRHGSGDEMGWRFLHALRRRGDDLRSTIAKLAATGRRLPLRVGRAARIAAELLRAAAALELRAGLRRRREARLVRHSDVFDARFYLAQCAGDREAERDPVAHYVRHGAARGLDPGPLFDTAEYLRRHPAVRASGENPLAHLVRSRAAAARALPAPGGRPAALGPLLRGPPPGGPPCAVLVVDGTPPGPSPEVRGGRTAVLVEVLREVGHPVILFSAGAPGGAGAPRAQRPQRHGLDEALGHLQAEGFRYGLVLLAGVDGTARHLAAVRAHAPSACVVYDAAGVHGRRLARDAAAGGDGAALAEAERQRKVEKVNAACADLVLVASAHEREALLAELPDARIEVLAQEPGAPAATAARLGAVLSACGFRGAGASAATREGAA